MQSLMLIQLLRRLQVDLRTMFGVCPLLLVESLRSTSA
jgi:hypothetical protein